jgi:hypothetical protein
MQRLLRHAAVLLCAASSVARIHAEPVTSGSEWLLLVSPAVEAIDGPPKEEFKAKYKPVVLAGRNLEVGSAGTAYGAPIRVVSRDQLRDEQLAYFIWFTRVEIDGDKAKVLYEQPSSGHFGNVMLARQEGSWKVTEKREAHSSSGARDSYGSLYDGVTCRDGTEMSGRWNYYRTMMQAMAERKPFDYKASVPEVCPGSEFPEVTQYRKAKAQ